MNKAFILLNTEVGLEKDVYEEIATYSCIKEIYRVYGVYDIIFQIEEQNLEQLKHTISLKIRSIQGIRATSTLIIL